MRQITRLIEQPATNAHWQEAAKLRQVVCERLGWDSRGVRSHLDLSEQMEMILMAIWSSGGVSGGMRF